MYKKLSVFILGATLAISFCAARADTNPPQTSEPATQKLPKQIATLQKRGVLQVIRQFEAPAGMTGFVLKERGRYLIVYGRGDYVFSGALIDPDDHDLTAKYYAQYVPKTEYSKTVKQLERSGGLITFSTNAAAPVLYAFEDPNCIFCYRFNKVIFPLVDQGKVQLKVVLVAFLKPDSLARASAILAAKDPRAAMRRNEARYVTSQEEGGYPAPAKPEQKFAARVQENGKLMNAAGFTGTPSLIYHTKSGKWNGIGGMPTTSVLNKIIDGSVDVAQ